MRTQGASPSEGQNPSSDTVTASEAGGNQRMMTVGDEARPVQVGAIYKSRNVNIVVNYEGSSVSISETSKTVSNRHFLLRIQGPVLAAEIGFFGGIGIVLALHFLGLSLLPWLVAAAGVGTAAAVLTWLAPAVLPGFPGGLTARPTVDQDALDQTVALATLAVEHVPRLVDACYKNGLDGEAIRGIWALGEQVAEIQRTLARKVAGTGRPQRVPRSLLAQSNVVLKDIVLLGQTLERESPESINKRLANLADRLRRLEVELKTLP